MNEANSCKTPVFAFIEFQEKAADSRSLFEGFLSLIQKHFSGSFVLNACSKNPPHEDCLAALSISEPIWHTISEESFEQLLKTPNLQTIPISMNSREFGTFYIIECSKQDQESIHMLCMLLSQGLGRLCQSAWIADLSARLSKESQRNNLLYSIAHDLRTPLTGIIGISEILLEESLPQKETSLVKEIRTDAKRLHGILENVLSLVRLGQESLHIPKQLECLNEIIEEVIQTFAKGKTKDRIIEFDSDELIFSKVNARLIYQVLINLVDNAFKHSPENTPVLISLSENEGQAIIEVSDQGEGISETALPHIFDLYYTTRANREAGMKGSGLGLPICSSIVTAHNGTISANNVCPGPGAVFTVALPAVSLQA